jgi:hypothetical protein
MEVRGGLIEEARERDVARGVDGMERVGRAAAQAKRAEVRARIRAHMGAVDSGRAYPRIDIDRGMAVAGREPGPQRSAEAGVDAADDAARVVAQRRRVAVAVDPAPGTQPLRPPGEIAHRTRGSRRRLDRKVVLAGVGVRLARDQIRAAERQRAEIAGGTRIGPLTQPGQQLVAQEMKSR